MHLEWGLINQMYEQWFILIFLKIWNLIIRKLVVQDEMVMKTRDPMGHARYWPIYEASEEAGLPISVHVGGGAPNPAISGGWPSYHYEFRNGLVQAAQAQLISLIGSGVFNTFPNLKVVLVEGGFAWVPALLWV